MGIVYAVSMNKGGVGKTSLVANLAGALVKKYKKKVLIIDTDGQGNASMAFGIKNPHTQFKHTIYDVLMGDKEVEDVLYKVDKQLHIIPANKQMNFLEFDVLPHLKKYGNPFHLLKDRLGNITDNYDYVFIDTPPSLGLVQGNVLSIADKVMIPFHPEPFGDIGLISVIEVIQDFKVKENPTLEIAGVVGMKVETINNVHTDLFPLAKQYCDKHGIHVFETVIPKTVRFASSIAYSGKPATMTDLKHPSVKLYYNLLEEVLLNDKKK
jgi:chromosome partitioning protein